MMVCTEEMAEPWDKTKDHQKESKVMNSNRAQLDGNCIWCPCVHALHKLEAEKETHAGLVKQTKGGTEDDGQRLKDF